MGGGDDCPRDYCPGDIVRGLLSCSKVYCFIILKINMYMSNLVLFFFCFVSFCFCCFGGGGGGGGGGVIIQFI